MNKYERLQNEVENILSSLPDGFRLEWQFHNELVEFKITEKPIGYSKDNEQLLISELNKIVLSFQESDSNKRFDPIQHLTLTNDVAKRCRDIGNGEATFINHIDKLSKNNP